MKVTDGEKLITAVAVKNEGEPAESAEPADEDSEDTEATAEE